ncbi:hypothetical protein GCM10027577_42000 [Spirosoma fluminis]
MHPVWASPTVVLCLVWLCSNGLTTQAWAQVADSGKASSWQKEILNRYTNLHRQTLRLAKQRAWPIHKKYSSTRTIQLQDVDAFGQPVYYVLHNMEAAEGTRTVSIQGNGSLPVALSGNSPRMTGKLGLWDGGRVLATHQELGTSRITQTDNTASLNDHTTHLAGTLIGKGVNAKARGMAYGAQLAVWDYTNDIAELVKAAPNLLLSNHAYGPVVGWVYNPSRPGTDPKLKWEWWGNTTVSATEDYQFGFYTEKAQDLDRTAYNNPFLLMVRSADNKRADTGPPDGTPYYLKNTTTKSTAARRRNDSYDVIPAEATAKNVLTVGAADVTFDKQNRPVSLNSTSFSGWGPTDDGRIKPDLLGIGTDVFSTLAGSNTAYGLLSGTSMASANVSGSLFLLQELYARQQAAQGNTASQFMRAATLRGLALHTADRINPAAGPDYRQGWGLLNTEAAARVLLNEELAHQMLEQSLKSGSTFTHKIVAQGNEPLIITLSWTDPAGTATPVSAASLNKRTPKLINDLDLRLSDGTFTSFPFVLDPDQPNRAAITNDNFRDNVEQIYLARPVAGQTYSVTVSHKSKLTYTTQPFSLIVSGLRRVRCDLTAGIAPPATATLCAGSMLSLRSSTQATGVTYQWLRDGLPVSGAATTSLQLSQPGAYVLKVTDANGCQATSPPVQIQERTPVSTLSPTGDQWVCSSQKPIVLKAMSDSDTSYEWFGDGIRITGASSSSLSVNQPGSYQVQVTQAGCKALSSATTVRLTTVNTIDLQPSESELILPQGAAVTLTAPVDATYSYQWLRDTIALQKATTYRLSVTQPGVYKVRITQQNCVGWSPARIIRTAILTGTSLGPDNRFRLYPNPAESLLTVDYVPATTQRVQVSVYNLHGVLVYNSLPLRTANGLLRTVVPVSHLMPGQYILQLTDGLTTRVGRFTKQ